MYYIIKIGKIKRKDITAQITNMLYKLQNMVILEQ